MEAIIPVGVAYTQLLEDVRAVVRHELASASMAPVGAGLPTVPTDDLLSIREAAEMLGITVQTVHEHKRRGILIYHKLGSRSYLKRAEVLASLQSQQRTKK